MSARFTSESTAAEIRELVRLGLIGDHVGRLALVERGDSLGARSSCHEWKAIEYPREFRCARCSAWLRRDGAGAVESYTA